jgi:16S rRNA (uracil1498-N3)-methyltransferase
MPNYDFRSPRLYVEASLGEGTEVALNASQSHYLGTVLRLKPGSRVLVFNGRDGEWAASFTAAKRTSALFVSDQTRPQSPATDLHYVFAPIKAARLDYMVQKAVEMGVSQLQPVFTRHSQVARVNTERMRANAIEAAEQCGILCLPEIAEPVAFSQLLAQWDPARRLVFCDEDAETIDPLARLADLPRLPLAVLIGPEGGFAEDERTALLRLPNIIRLSLGPRILRADTAAVAALTLVQAVLGDWRSAGG